MLPTNRIITRLVVVFAILTLPHLVVHGSGGGIEDKGDRSIAKWSSGTTELAVAGFNYDSIQNSN